MHNQSLLVNVAPRRARAPRSTKEMKLEQKKLLRGKRSFTLSDTQLQVSMGSFLSKNEWTVDLEHLDSSVGKTKKTALGAWLFTAFFGLGFIFSIIGIFATSEGSDAFAAYVVFIFLSFIPMLLGFYKAITESYDWTVVYFRNGNASLFMFSGSPSERELDDFLEELKKSIEACSQESEGKRIRTAVDLLVSKDVISEEDSERMIQNWTNKQTM